MALITLKEYAERLGKNPLVVYQKARYGTLKTARKLGRDWVIDEDEPYEDKRIKSGKYVNWKYGYQYQKERKARKAAEEAAAASDQTDAEYQAYMDRLDAIADYDGPLPFPIEPSITFGEHIPDDTPEE